MLKSLHVQNFALIDDLDMTFNRGLSALTGETGAGKSIILESLNLLFGKRSDAQMIRHGEKKAVVSGLFDVPKTIQDQFDLTESIEVEREIDRSGRHQIKLNGEITTLSRIKDVMQTIGFIHSQQETMTLFDRSYYVTFIDQMNPEETEKLRNSYLFMREAYLDLSRKDQKLKEKKKESLEMADFYRFQIDELKKLNLKPHEKVELEDKVEKMRHHDKILQQLREANQIFSEDVLPIDLVYQAHRAIEKIASLDPTYQEICDRLSAAYYELDDVKSLLFTQLHDLDFDEETFNYMQERIHTIENMEQKYHRFNDELITYFEEIESNYQLITDYDHYIEQSAQKVKESYEKAYQAGLKLHDFRVKLAKKLEKEILNQLKDLDLDKASFEVNFDAIDADAELLESGLDQVEFLISLNEGEPIKPLSKVASGGERARFMFALRAIDAIQNARSLLILDEIDIGISGKTAAKVARKMVELSSMLQLIVITHLPQVAARANHHYDIMKIKEDDRMVTRIKYLNDTERIQSIALMLSDEKLSTYAIEQAKMLLEK